jgi:hypothetical protein
MTARNIGAAVELSEKRTGSRFPTTAVVVAASDIGSPGTQPCGMGWVVCQSVANYRNLDEAQGRLLQRPAVD